MIRARVQNGRWVLDDPAGLPEGTVVEIVTRPAPNASPDVYVDSSLRDYVRALVSAATSPRNGPPGRSATPQDEEQIVESAKAVARGSNRNYVTPADVQTVAPEHLYRLIVVPPDASARGIRGEDIVRAIMKGTPAP